MASRESINGAVLEEALAYLIRNAGYQLLVDEQQDPDELRNRANGLVVRGRGTGHQVDVLGQLAWIPAFTFPLRLFVEAKWHGEVKTGLRTVRNAVGVIQDVNQNYFTAGVAHGGRARLVRRFTYCYSLFSTTGFTEPAEDMALAHQISLIDLSGPDFGPVREAVDQLGTLVFDRAGRVGRRANNPGQVRVIPAIRRHMRRKLETWPVQVPFRRANADADIENLLGDLGEFDRSLGRLTAFGEFFVGMVNGPFLLVLRADDPAAFVRFADAHPTHNITINWVPSARNDYQGVIRSAQVPEAYTLFFGLPSVLQDYILVDENRGVRLDPTLKRKFFSDITIYRRVQNRDTLYRLTYDPNAVRLLRGPQ